MFIDTLRPPLTSVWQPTLIDTMWPPLTSVWMPPIAYWYFETTPYLCLDATQCLLILWDHPLPLFGCHPVLIDTLRPPLTSVWQPPLIMTPVLLLYPPPPSPASVLPSTSNEWSPNTSEHRANASLRTSKTDHLIHIQLLVPVSTYTSIDIILIDW